MISRTKETTGWSAQWSTSRCSHNPTPAWWMKSTLLCLTRYTMKPMSHPLDPPIVWRIKHVNRNKKSETYKALWPRAWNKKNHQSIIKVIWTKAVGQIMVLKISQRYQVKEKCRILTLTSWMKLASCWIRMLIIPIEVKLTMSQFNQKCKGFRRKSGSPKKTNSHSLAMGITT